MIGRTEPRLRTPPLRELTPDTSVGFDQIEYARDVLGRPLDPWQELAAIAAGELRPDGSLRFRIVILLVARQQGKTELLAILPAYWLDVDEVPTVVGISNKLEHAEETWEKTRQMIDRAPDLEPARIGRWYRIGNGKTSMTLTTEDGARCTYKIAAANGDAGRSKTIHRLIVDEFRQIGIEVWDAAEPATSAVDNPQIWCASNAGTDRSTLLNGMRDAAIAYIETGEGADDVLLLEWSAPDDADPCDLDALAMANPNLGRRGRRPAALLAMAQAAVAAGSEDLALFKTNYMCIRVKVEDPAIDPGAWARCLDPAVVPGPEVLRRALCIDVSLDGQHVTLAAAAVLDDGRVVVGIVGAWSSTKEARRGLARALKGSVSPVLGWLPTGPAAQMAADLADRSTAQRQNRPSAVPDRMRVEEIRAEVSAVCMGLEELARSGTLVHPGDPMLDEQVAAAERMKTGATWVFVRSGDVYVDAVYAVAGAAHLARTLPEQRAYRRLVALPSSG